MAVAVGCAGGRCTPERKSGGRRGGFAVVLSRPPASRRCRCGVMSRLSVARAGRRTGSLVRRWSRRAPCLGSASRRRSTAVVSSPAASSPCRERLGRARSVRGEADGLVVPGPWRLVQWRGRHGHLRQVPRQNGVSRRRPGARGERSAARHPWWAHTGSTRPARSVFGSLDRGDREEPHRVELLRDEVADEHPVIDDEDTDQRTDP